MKEEYFINTVKSAQARQGLHRVYEGPYWYYLDLDIEHAINPNYSWPQLTLDEGEILTCEDDMYSILNADWVKYANDRIGWPIEFVMHFIRNEGRVDLVAHSDAPVKSQNRDSYWAINWSLAPDDREQVWFDYAVHDYLFSHEDSPSTVGFYPYIVDPDRICDRVNIQQRPTLIRIDRPHWVTNGGFRIGISLRFMPLVENESWEWAVEHFKQRGLLIPR